MVNKSLPLSMVAANYRQYRRSVSDGVQSLEVRVVPLVVLITYKYVRYRHWFQFPKLSRKQSRPEIVEHRLFSQQLVTPYIKI